MDGWLFGDVLAELDIDPATDATFEVPSPDMVDADILEEVVCTFDSMPLLGYQPRQVSFLLGHDVPNKRWVYRLNREFRELFTFLGRYPCYREEISFHVAYRGREGTHKVDKLPDLGICFLGSKGTDSMDWAADLFEETDSRSI